MNSITRREPPSIFDDPSVAAMEDPFAAMVKRDALAQAKLEANLAAERAKKGIKDEDTMTKLLTGGVKAKKAGIKRTGPPVLTTELVEGDASMDNFLVLPQPVTQGRLMRMLSNLSTHVHAMNNSLEMLRQRVDSSERTMTEAEKLLAWKRAAVA